MKIYAVVQNRDNDECIDEIDIFDSFRVSAVFEDGTTIDNDIVSETSARAISTELEEAREWFADREPKCFLITYYRDGEVAGSEEV